MRTPGTLLQDHFLCSLPQRCPYQGRSGGLKLSLETKVLGECAKYWATVRQTFGGHSEARPDGLCLCSFLSCY